MKALATPAGIDHDYNFLSKIEREVERSDRLITEERGLVEKKELLKDWEAEREREEWRSSRGYGDREGRGRGSSGFRDRRQQRVKRVSPLEETFQRARVVVDRAPKGMKRAVTNTTNFSRNQKCLNWQVEWVLDRERWLGKMLESEKIGVAYQRCLQEKKRESLTEEEKKGEKKRKAREISERGREKRAKLEVAAAALPALMSPALLQKGDGTWSIGISSSNLPHLANVLKIPGLPSQPVVDPNLHFYLHRPYTPAHLPTVLIPLSASEPLSIQLQNHTVLEYPTIYVLDTDPNHLPSEYMLEDIFLGGKPKVDASTKAKRIRTPKESKIDIKKEKEKKPKTASLVLMDYGSSDGGGDGSEDDEENRDDGDESEDKQIEDGEIASEDEDEEMVDIEDSETSSSGSSDEDDDEDSEEGDYDDADPDDGGHLLNEAEDANADADSLLKIYS
jgi:hypothetical protein